MSTTMLCPKVPDIFRRVHILKKYLRFLLDRFCINSALKPRRYQPLQRSTNSSKSYEGAPTSSTFLEDVEKGFGKKSSSFCSLRVDGGRDYKDSDLVSMKISLLGDRHIGKTSFLAKYMGDEKDQSGDLRMEGLNYINKVQYVKGARLFFNICEVEGNDQHVLSACKDSVAILFMFDLTSRCTLNGVIKWYQEARKSNQTAIPILIGTKFDDFVQLPIDLQWTIASQARTYAKALNATLFFSSSTYNINVNKVFKFITAKLFNLPWSVERNLTIGEPIIDF